MLVICLTVIYILNIPQLKSIFPLNLTLYNLCCWKEAVKYENNNPVISLNGIGTNKSVPQIRNYFHFHLHFYVKYSLQHISIIRHYEINAPRLSYELHSTIITCALEAASLKEVGINEMTSDRTNQPYIKFQMAMTSSNNANVYQHVK